MFTATVLLNTKTPENICIHIIIPAGTDAGKVCRHVETYRFAHSDKFCVTKEKVCRLHRLLSVH
jgi:hypothetical protein